MLLLMGIINTRGHYARCKNLRIQPVTRVDSDLSSYDMIEWPEEHKCMRLTNRCEESALSWSKMSSPSGHHEEGKTVTKHETIPLKFWLFEKVEAIKKYIKTITSSRDGWSPYSLDRSTDSTLYRKRIFVKRKK